MTTAQIKPCPFCGGTERVYNEDTGYFKYTTFEIGCPKCGARMTSIISREDSLLKWNKRAPVSEEEVVERVKAIAKRPEVLRAALRYAVAIIDTLFDDEEEEDAEE